MRIAAVQDSPVFLDRAATLSIVQKRIIEAGEGGADLILELLVEFVVVLDELPD